jgi:hypothetical protein
MYIILSEPDLVSGLKVKDRAGETPPVGPEQANCHVVTGPCGRDSRWLLGSGPSVPALRI